MRIWPKKCRRIPRDLIVILLTVFADSEGNDVCPSSGGRPLSAVSPAPLYAPYDTYIGNGIVGGFVETFESVGVRAADMALQILAGKDPATIAPRTNPGTGLSGRSQGDARWGSSEKQPSSRNCRLVQEADDLGPNIEAPFVAAILIVALQSLICWRTAVSAAEKAARRKSAQGKRRADDVRRRCGQYWALAI